MKKKFRILTNDPSFTAWGYAVIETDGTILESGCLKTSPEHKKKRIRASDDRIRRATDIVQDLIGIISDYSVQYMLSEAPHGSQNAQGAIMIGIVTGITCTLSECLGVPIEYYSEQDAKKALLGKKAASKGDIIEAIDKLYNMEWRSVKYIDEAVADALAVFHVAMKQSTTLKMMINEDKN